MLKRETAISLTGLGLGLSLLMLQFALTIPARMATGASVVASVVFYFSFFTVLSNIGVTLTYLASLTNWARLDWFRRHQTRTMFAVLILIVMLVYHFLLAGIWQPAGLFKLADIGLHYVAPLLYLTWWAMLHRSEPLKLSQIGTMMAPALIYIVYVFVRGAVSGLYPYPFIDAGILGYNSTMINSLVLLVISAAMMALFIGIDRLLLKFFQK